MVSFGHNTKLVSQSVVGSGHNAKLMGQWTVGFGHIVETFIQHHLLSALIKNKIHKKSCKNIFGDVLSKLSKRSYFTKWPQCILRTGFMARCLVLWMNEGAEFSATGILRLCVKISWHLKLGIRQTAPLPWHSSAELHGNGTAFCIQDHAIKWQ